MKRLGVIGCGNMGGAMLRQAIRAGVYRPEEILLSDKNAALLRRVAAETGAETGDNPAAAAAETLLLAVKPQFAKEVLEEIAPHLGEKTLVLSIVAGLSLEGVRAALGNERARVVRVMPNTPALIGEGVLAACRGADVTEEEWERAASLLSCMGLFQEVPQRLMDAVTGLSGSAPAFVFLFLEALADAGVRAGLPRDMAQRFAAQVISGSGRLALETGLHPGQLKDMVTSPAGTTIEGVAALERNGFRYAVMEAVDAAVNKSRNLGK